MRHLKSNLKSIFSSFVSRVGSAAKVILAAAILTSFSVSALAATTVGESSEFTNTANSTWVKVITLAVPADGASSQGAQTFSMNVTALPEGGANYRVFKTTANGSDFFTSAQALSVGANDITVGSVAFDRAVKIQLSSPEIAFDALSVNGVVLYIDDGAISEEPVDDGSSDEPAAGITLDDSSDFYDKNHATWVKVIDLALAADGSSSQATQTLSMNVTELPEGGANYRVFKTVANGSDFLGGAQALFLGANNISVSGVAFDRSVKVQFSSSAVRFDALSVNGSQLYPELPAPSNDNDQIAGDWSLAPVAGAIGVGPSQGDTGWWSTSDGDVSGRACLFDDVFAMNVDGSFENQMGADTWLEGWQGAAEGCGAPVAPHDGSSAATYSYDATAGTLTVVGEGAHIGLAKVTNQGEDGVATDNTIVYLVTELTDTTMTLDVQYPSGFWRFKLVNSDYVAPVPTTAFVTFQVDMTAVETNADGVYLAGGPFGQDGHALTDDGADVWSVTLELDQNTQYLYKFRNQPSYGTWDGFEDTAGLIAGGCNAGQYNDRFVDVADADIVLDVVAYDSCTAEPYVAPVVSLPTAPVPTDAADSVLSIFGTTYGNLAGADFNPNWGQSTSVDAGDNLAYTNLNYQGTAFANQDVSGYEYLNVDYYVTESTAVNFFLIGDGGETSVALDVSATEQWVNVQIPLTSYSSVVNLADVFQFKVDGNGAVAFNNLYFGGTVAPADVPGCTDAAADNYNAAATSDDGSCVTAPTTVSVTFQVDMTAVDTNADGVYLAGGPFGQDGHALTDDGADVWSVTLELDQNTQYLYKFRNQPSYGGWDGFEDAAGLIAGGCNSGQYNDRFVDVADADIVLDVVAYGSCDATPYVAPVVSLPTAPVPTDAADSVLSIFGTTYGNLAGADFNPNWGQSTSVDAGDNLAYTNLNYQGTAFANQDVSGYEYLNVDYYVTESTAVNFFLIGDGGETSVALDVSATEQWVNVQIPLTSYSSVVNLADVFQFKVDGNGAVAFNNLYFGGTVAAPEPPAPSNDNDQIAGDWSLAPVAGAIGVGPSQGDTGWWSNSDGDVSGRACLFDDVFAMNVDGSFENVMGADTWLEGWQGAAEGCGAPVAPHDGSSAATYSYDATAGTLTVVGEGAHIGLAKVTNQGEDGVATDNTIVYLVTELTDTTMTLDVQYPSGFWRFKLVNSDYVAPVPTTAFVTFQVDMTAVETNADGVYLAGGPFGQDGHALTDDGADVWSVTLELDQNTQYLYKFRNQPSYGTWDGFEDTAGLIAGGCNAGQYNDRFVDVADADIVLDVVAYDSCTAEPYVAPVVSLPTAPVPTDAADSVLSIFGTTYGNLAGADFNPNWGQSTSVDAGDNLAYTNLNYQGTAFANQDVSGYEYLNVDYYVTESTAVNFFLIGDGGETSVALDVSATEQWVNVQIPLTSYSSVVNLADVFQFKVDGNGAVAFNNLYFGGTVAPADVPGCTDAAADNYNAAATSDDGSCVTAPTTVSVTFQVDMTAVDTNADGVYLAGGPFGQDGHALTDDGADVWSVTLELDQNTQYLYKFRNQPSYGGWDGFEDAAGLIAGGCNAGQYNDRFVDVADADIVLDVVAYGSCDATPYVAPVVSLPTAPVPTDAADSVLSIFGTTYGNLAGADFNPNWGQSTSVDAGDNLAYTNLNYQGTAFANQDVSGYEYLNVDYYVTESTAVNFFLIGDGGETSVALDVSATEQWVNVQIPLTSYSSVVNLADVFQFKVDGNGAVAFNNLYFGGTVAPADVPGCTDSTADNYSADATVDDDSCLFTLDTSETASVTFQLNMDGVDTTNGVSVMGGAIFGQAGLDMSDEDGDDVWTVTTELVANTTVMFKYRNTTALTWDGQESVAAECAHGEWGDRQVVVGEDDITLDVVGWGLCTDVADEPVDPVTSNWDFDGNGNVDALTDGLLLVRYAFGLRGEFLSAGSVATDSPLSASDVELRLSNAVGISDIDGDGRVDALTDGLLLLRHLFNLSGEALVKGVVHPDGTRQTADEISAYIENKMPSIDVPGCTDSAADNYDATATSDDGSCVTTPSNDNDQIAGDWSLAPVAGAIGVGPSQGDTGWWSNSDGDVSGRACLFDDVFAMNVDGSFENVMGADTWLEGWQGAAEGCGAPVAPHDGSSAATYSYDATAGTLTVVGEGAHIGLAKVTNQGEDGVATDNTIVYLVTELTDTTMTLDVQYPSGFWRFKLVNSDYVAPVPTTAFVTFQVDMTAVETNADGVYLAGGPFGQDGHALTDDGADVWSVTLELDQNTQYLYKFRNQPSYGTWDGFEDTAGLIAGGCNAGQYNDRFVDVADADIVLDVVAYDSCTAEPYVAPVVSLPTAPVPTDAADSVLSIFGTTYGNLAGADFNPNWGQSTSVDAGDNLAYTNLNYQGTAFANQDVSGYEYLNVDYYVTESTAVNFFLIGDGGETSVALDVSATEQWVNVQIPLTSYSSVVNLADVFQFKVDGNGAVAFNNLYFGGTVAPADVPGCTDAAADNYNAAATSDDGSCVTAPTTVSVTFQVDMTAVDTNADGVYLAGGPFGQDGHALTDDGADVWSVTLELDQNTQYLYKFRNQPSYGGWDGFEDAAGLIAGGCNAGQYNDRFVDVADADIVLDVVAYGSCDATPYVAPVVSLPTAPVPTDAADSVLSIFGTTYGNLAGADFNPNWGQSTSVDAGDNLAYTNLNYQGTAFANQDVSGYEYLNVDYYVTESTAVNFFLIGDGGETSVALDVSATEQWVNVQIPLTSYSVVNLADVFQFKVDGNGAVAFNNLYFGGTVAAPEPPAPSNDNDQIAGDWSLAPVAGAIGVGPSQGDTGWWSNSDGDVSGRACLFDDVFAMNVDGSFENVMGADTWLEGWQGAAEGCGAPVAPHDGSSAATYSYDATAGTLTVVGEGAHIGLAKVTNQGEDGVATDNTIVYLVTELTDTTMTLDVQYPSGFWRFKLVNSDYVAPVPTTAFVTFQVDMTAVETNADGVYLAGGPFGQDGHALTDDGADVWSVTLELDQNTQYLYKFRNQPSYGTWDGFEDTAGLIAGGCNAGQYNDRFVDVADADIVLDVVAYDSCTAEPYVAPVVSLPTAPVPTDAADSVLSIFGTTYGNLAGADFNPNWGQSTSVDAGDNLAYTNLNYQGTAFANQDVSGYEYLNVDYYVTESTAVNFFLIGDGGETSVALDVSATEQWVNVQIPLTSYSSVVNLADVFQFKVDGNGAVAFNNLYFGGTVAPADVPGCTDAAADNYNAAATSDDGSCVTAPTTVSVTFQVDMTAVDTNADGVYLAGGPFGQDGHALTDDGADVWSVTLELDQNTQYLYKFRNQPSYGGWDGFEDAAGLIAGGCNAGQYNDRFVDVADADIVLDVVAYGSCDATPYVAPVVSLPTAPVPTDAADSVLSIFGTTYGNLAGADFNPNWGQSTSVDAGDNLAYTNLNYQGTAFANQDVSGYEYLNVDYYVTESTAVNFFLIGDGGETSVALDVSATEQWVNVQIPLTSYSVVNLADVFQFKVDGNGAVAFNNLYFGGTVAAPEPPAPSNDNDQIAGDWSLAPVAGAIGVGPSQGDTGWWSNSDGDVSGRACLFDDVFAMNVDGSFENVMGADTWLEGWQGAAEGCGAPVAPHDGSSAATYSYDATAGTLTVVGEGAHIGLAKVTNQGEDGVATDNTIVYLVTELTDTTMTLDVQYPSGFWRFKLVNSDYVAPLPTTAFVTFQVDMTAVETNADGVYLAGGPFGQDGHALTDDGADVWSVTLELDQNTQYLYKFRNQPSYGTWDGFEDTAGLIAGGCNAGQYNDRFVDVADADIVLDVVAYDSCTAEPYVAPVVSLPTAPVPTDAADSVLSIFGTTYGNLAGADFNPNWGQSTSVDAGDNLAYTNLNYQGTAFANQDVSGYEYLNVDYYVTESTAVNFFLIGDGGETSVALDVSATEQWVNVQIPLTSYSSVVNLADVFQFKVDGNGAVAFNNLYFGGTVAAPEPEAPAGITIAESSDFYDKNHATWVKVINLALTSDGASSQAAQTLSMNVTELPEGGVNYRVFKTTANGGDFLGNAQALSLGANDITVGGVGFDRAVKIQLSSGDVRFDALSVNGNTLYPE